MSARSGLSDARHPLLPHSHCRQVPSCGGRRHASPPRPCPSILHQFGVATVEWLHKLTLKQRTEIPESDLLSVMLNAGARARPFGSMRPVEQDERLVLVRLTWTSSRAPPRMSRS